jgi:hypothetical protein
VIDEIKLNEINLREEATWGAPAIAKIARVSPDVIPEWAKLADCPITKPDGKRYFVLKSALVRWLTTKKAIAA